MHDIIPKVTLEQKRRSMGFFAIWWIETFCVVGSPPAEDEPMVFTPEYAEFLWNNHKILSVRFENFKFV